MKEQIPLELASLADLPHGETSDHTHEIAPDLAYQRLAMVNVVYWGLPHTEDRQWVLIDTGVPGLTSMIERAARKRFG